MIDLKARLIKKYNDETLAQVYLASYGHEENIQEWVTDFLSPITTLPDHPDVFWVTRSEKENDYKVDSPSIKAMLKFINYRPIELKVRFIFISDAHLLSPIVSNKLLKVLEEMSSLFCLILFTPEGQSLLPTVESRALKIRIKSGRPLEPVEVIHYESAFDVLADLRSSDDPFFVEKKFIESQLNLLLSKTPTFKQCDEILASLKHYDQSDRFNNAKVSRLSLLFP